MLWNCRTLWVVPMAISRTASRDVPAGLSFDAATQTISGTPTAATEVTTVTYVVLDTDKKAVAPWQRPQD